MKLKMFGAAATLVLVVAGCTQGPGDSGEEWPEHDERGYTACYYADGKFAKYDDDCEDDGLYTKRNLPKPLKTSGGLKTSGPIKPVSPTKPVVRTTRR